MSETLIEIQGCQVSQTVPGLEDKLLSGPGPLALLHGDPSSQSNEAEALTLAVGTSAFALHPNKTPFYTHADSSRMYLFTPDLGAEAGTGAGVYVKVMLPHEAELPGNKAFKARDQFEEILVKYGYLKPREKGEEGAKVGS